jgi:hypothetical protein
MQLQHEKHPLKIPIEPQVKRRNPISVRPAASTLLRLRHAETNAAKKWNPFQKKTSINFKKSVCRVSRCLNQIIELTESVKEKRAEKESSLSMFPRTPKMGG